MDYYGGERSVKTSSVANPLFEVAHSRVADFRQGGGTALYADADFQYLRNLVAFGFPQYGYLQNTDTSRNTSVVTRTRWLLDNCLIIAATGQFKPPSPSSSSSPSWSPPSSSPPWSPRSPSPKVFQLGIQTFRNLHFYETNHGKFLFLSCLLLFSFPVAMLTQVLVTVRVRMSVGQ